MHPHVYTHAFQLWTYGNKSPWYYGAKKKTSKVLFDEGFVFLRCAGLTFLRQIIWRFYSSTRMSLTCGLYSTVGKKSRHNQGDRALAWAPEPCSKLSVSAWPSPRIWQALPNPVGSTKPRPALYGLGNISPGSKRIMLTPSPACFPSCGHCFWEWHHHPLSTKLGLELASAPASVTPACTPFCSRQSLWLTLPFLLLQQLRSPPITPPHSQSNASGFFHCSRSDASKTLVSSSRSLLETLWWLCP